MCGSFDYNDFANFLANNRKGKEVNETCISCKEFSNMLFISF